MTGLGLLAGSANVIMQLGHPAVGYGVFESRVESGQINRHPIKRTRTTLSYLAVAGMGDDETKAAYRKATNRSHAAVKSTPDSPVKYSAFDPTLQLWVAACLYRGLEDVYVALYGPPDPDTVDEMYQACHVLGSTLQMPPEMWPADRAAFEKYWDAALDDIHIDPTIRRYLHGIASATFTKPAVLHPLIGPFFRFVTTGFLPQRFGTRWNWPGTRSSRDGLRCCCAARPCSTGCRRPSCAHFRSTSCSAMSSGGCARGEHWSSTSLSSDDAAAGATCAPRPIPRCPDDRSPYPARLFPPEPSR